MRKILLAGFVFSALGISARAADSSERFSQLGGCQATHVCRGHHCTIRLICPPECPDRYSCYDLYGAYGPYGGQAYLRQFTGGEWKFHY
jgi:hypothetical protein